MCEPCLELARTSGLLFTDALAVASVRGNVPQGAEVVSRRCAAGHEIVLRRGARPSALPRHDDRQLQLT